MEHSSNILPRLRARFPNWIRAEINKVRFFQTGEAVFLEITLGKGSAETVSHTDLKFVRNGTDELVFPPFQTPNANANRFARDFDAYSIANCTNLFTSQAGWEVAQRHDSQAPLDTVAMEDDIRQQREEVDRAFDVIGNWAEAEYSLSQQCHERAQNADDGEAAAYFTQRVESLTAFSSSRDILGRDWQRLRRMASVR